MRRMDEQYLADIQKESGKNVADLCRVVHTFLNEIVAKENGPDRLTFDQEKERLTELVAPFGLIMGDSEGGFATGTKWYDLEKSLWVRWNTWHNYFTVVIYEDWANKKDRGIVYSICSDALMDRWDKDIKEIREEGIKQ